MNIGERITSLRNAKHLTQERLAAELGIKRARYNAWENGIASPDNEMLKKIANFFKVSSDYLLGLVDNPNNDQESCPIEMVGEMKCPHCGKTLEIGEYLEGEEGFETALMCVDCEAVHIPLEEEYAEERASHNEHVTELCLVEDENKKLRNEIEALKKEIGRLKCLIDTPETEDWMKAVPFEAAHQQGRWGEYDQQKNPLDWFWLIGYLAQKAAFAHISGDVKKAKHHTISTAATLLNWHRKIQKEKR